MRSQSLQTDNKPVPLMRELMKKLSHGCAAMHFGLRFVGVDVHRQYFDEAFRRI